MKNIRAFCPKIFSFLVMKFSINLNRRFCNGTVEGCFGKTPVFHDFKVDKAIQNCCRRHSQIYYF